MPRRKITLELKGLRTPRERMWSAMLGYDQQGLRTFTPSMVEDLAFPLHKSTVEDYLAALAAGGYIERIAPQKRDAAKPNFGPTMYRLVKRQADAPHVDQHGQPTIPEGRGGEAMWRMAKVLCRFSAVKLADAASQGGVVVTPATAKSYCNLLTRSGHFRLAARQTSRKGNAPSLFEIANNTGPHAPAITREKCVFDRNTGTLTPVRTAQEVCDALG